MNAKVRESLVIAVAGIAAMIAGVIIHNAGVPNLSDCLAYGQQCGSAATQSVGGVVVWLGLAAAAFGGIRALSYYSRKGQ